MANWEQLFSLWGWGRSAGHGLGWGLGRTDLARPADPDNLQYRAGLARQAAEFLELGSVPDLPGLACSLHPLQSAVRSPQSAV